jgi:hypothetical protein
MPMYERGAGAHVAERVRVPEGSEDEARYEELVKGGGNWRRVEDEAPADPDESGYMPPPAEQHELLGELTQGLVKVAPPDPEDSGAKPKLPNRTASKADWKAYAIASGMDEADVEKATRDELAELYHGPKG